MLCGTSWLEEVHDDDDPDRPGSDVQIRRRGDADQDLEVLAATRAHIEIYRSAMEQRGLAASTIDPSLTTQPDDTQPTGRVDVRHFAREPGGPQSSPGCPAGGQHSSCSMPWPTPEDERTLTGVSDAAHHRDQDARGTARLPADLTDAQLEAAPVVTSLDTLLIDDLTDDEDDAFAAAIDA